MDGWMLSHTHTDTHMHIHRHTHTHTLTHTHTHTHTHTSLTWNSIGTHTHTSLTWNSIGTLRWFYKLRATLWRLNRFHLTGILQGDSLSLIIFELCTNPLSFLLNKNSEGYKIGSPNDTSVSLSHLVFVDDLKTFASRLVDALCQLDIITKFSNDIGMSFGSDKCAYMFILKQVLPESWYPFPSQLGFRAGKPVIWCSRNPV